MIEQASLIPPQAFGFPAIIVGVTHPGKKTEGQTSMEELAALLKTLKLTVGGRVILHTSRVSSSHFLGVGKVEEVRETIQRTGAKLVVVDHTLSGPQVRNLEKDLCVSIIDRPGVILEIFALHAKSKQAKTQVGIAQLEYLLPRLSGAWTHFQRQTGGGVASRGMGEKQIEIDRRRVRERIARLSKRLETISKERMTQRKKRQAQLKVAIVGYTNSGKTTLMKGLTKSLEQGEDALFATLDAQTRTLDPNARPKVLMSDTVGFIHNLPHGLIESFKSTLDEVCCADLVLHVVDISSPDYLRQIETTESVLAELGADHIPKFVFLNKTDQLDEAFLPNIVRRRFPDVTEGSALNPKDVSKLRSKVLEFFAARFPSAELSIPVEDQGAQSLVHSMCIVDEVDFQDSQDGYAQYKVRGQPEIIAQLSRYKKKRPRMVPI
ncbi:MAG: GTPase HflX [Zetaproteobacteria bacterium]|nr:GTPase HflX [Zetaproteobacteria bacterium]